MESPLVISSFSRGQLHPKSAALARFRFNPDEPAHTCDSLAHDGEANAGATISAFGMDALENAEHPLLGFFRDANAVILEPQPHLAVDRLAPKANFRLSPGRDEFHGVVE